MGKLVRHPDDSIAYRRRVVPGDVVHYHYRSATQVAMDGRFQPFGPGLYRPAIVTSIQSQDSDAVRIANLYVLFEPGDLVYIDSEVEPSRHQAPVPLLMVRELTYGTIEDHPGPGLWTVRS